MLFSIEPAQARRLRLEGGSYFHDITRLPTRIIQNINLDLST